MKAKTYLYPGADVGIAAAVHDDLKPGWPRPYGYVSLYDTGDADGGLTLYLSIGQMYALRDTINTSLLTRNQEVPAFRRHSLNVTPLIVTACGIACLAAGLVIGSVLR